MNGLDISGWLKLHANIASSLGVLLGGAAAIIVFFGGSIPPWYTPAQAQTDQRASAVIQQQTVQTLGKINERIDTLSKQVYSGECQKMRETLNQANGALSRNPSDQIARVLRDMAVNRMGEIPGCGN